MFKVTVVARMTARLGMAARVKEELLHMVAETRKEEGCINYDGTLLCRGAVNGRNAGAKKFAPGSLVYKRCRLYYG